MKMIATNISYGLDFSTLEVTSYLQAGHWIFMTGIIELSHLLLSSSSFIYKSDLTGAAGWVLTCTTTVGG
jgi:hypothetical protein